MEMAGVQSNDLILFRSVAQIKIIGTYRITLQADTEEFRLDTIFHPFIFGSEYLIQRFLQNTAIT